MYHDVHLDVSGFTAVDEIRDALRAAATAGREADVVRATLVGVCAPALSRGPMPDSGAAYLRVVDRSYAEVDDTRPVLAPTAGGAFVKRMNAEIADAPDEERRVLLRRARDVGLGALRGRTPRHVEWSTEASEIAVVRD